MFFKVFIRQDKTWTRVATTPRSRGQAINSLGSFYDSSGFYGCIIFPPCLDPPKRCKNTLYLFCYIYKNVYPHNTPFFVYFLLEKKLIYISYDNNNFKDFSLPIYLKWQLFFNLSPKKLHIKIPFCCCFC